MARTLTIVAERLHRNGGDEKDSVIKDIVKKVEDRNNAEVHDFARASTLSDLKSAVEKAIKEHPDDNYDIFQFVGHGAPGMLWLGGSWINRAGIPQGQKLVLNSNPDWYQVLLGVVPQGCEVRLVGCSIGSEIKLDVDDNADRIADGPTLLFDLARMWNCEVSAPEHLIDAAQFDGDGMFDIKENPVIKSSEITATQSRLQPEMCALDEVVDLRRPTFEIADVVSFPFARMFSLRKGESLIPLNTNPDHFKIKSLNKYILREVKSPELLAGPELELSLRVDSQPAIGQLILNLRLLRVVYGDYKMIRYFECDPEQNASLLSSVRQLMALYGDYGELFG